MLKKILEKKKNKLPVIKSLENLAFLLGLSPTEMQELAETANSLYRGTCIPKKSGGYRRIVIPDSRLKKIQRWILDNILYQIPTSDYSTGFEPNKSILDNAKKHLRQDCLINLDLQDFFPNIKSKEIFNVFKKSGYSKEIAQVLTRFCTKDESLPQGAPSSPYLANIVCWRLDRRMGQLAKKIGANYTRYADDMSISGKDNILSYYSHFCRIIESEGFFLNPKKKKINFAGESQMVTGLMVNEEVRVSAAQKESLRKHIYFCKKYGINSHLKYIKSSMSAIQFKNHLAGLARFIMMTEKEEGKKLLQEINTI